MPRQLPADVPGFTGRSAQLSALDALLDPGATPRVVIAALSGTAGVGKTALAVHWAHRVADRFPDGQLYVDLRGFHSSASAMSTDEAVRELLDAFGVPAQRAPVGLAAQVGLYRSLLAGRRVLVLLDNAREPEQVRQLLPGSPGCLLLVTSRDQLSGLVAVEGAHPVTVDLLSTAESRQLLANRLGPARVAAEPAAVDELVARCARLPLALAVTAARAGANSHFPLTALAEELRAAQGLEPFSGADAAADVRAVFFCSYRNLSDPAATLFRLLGVHLGPDVGLSAVASLAGLPVERVRPALAELTRAHLVAEHRPGRYTFHDLLRGYAAEQAHALDSESERRAALRRVLDHYLHTAHTAALLTHPHRDPVPLAAVAPGVTPEHLPDPARARDWFSTEHPVLVAAVELAAGHGFAAHCWQLAWALGDFLDWRGHWPDLVATQSVALTSAIRSDDPFGQAHSSRNLARAYIRLGRYPKAESLLRAALRRFGAAADRIGRAHTLLDLSLVLERRSRHREALGHAQRALAIFRATGHLAGQAKSLNAVGWYHTLLGDYPQALLHCEQSLAAHQRIGNRLGQAAAWDSLGYAHHHQGDHASAVTCYRRAIGLYREAGDRYNEADTLTHLGQTYRETGDLRRARATWRKALGILRDLDHPDADELRTRLADSGR